MNHLYNINMFYEDSEFILDEKGFPVYFKDRVKLKPYVSYYNDIIWYLKHGDVSNENALKLLDAFKRTNKILKAKNKLLKKQYWQLHEYHGFLHGGDFEYAHDAINESRSLAKTFCVGGTRVLLSCRIRERTLETENIVWDYGEYINELHDELDEILKKLKRLDRKGEKLTGMHEDYLDNIPFINRVSERRLY